MVKVAVLASFNMDLVMRVARRPETGETLRGEFAMHLGGKGFNQAVAARRLGAKVAVAGRVGDDEFGQRFVAALDHEGIDGRAVVVDPGAGTGVAMIFVEPDGTNTIVQSPRANLMTTAGDIDRALAWMGDTDVAISQRELSEEATARFMDVMCGRTTTLFNPAPAGDVPSAILRSSHIVVANQIEARSLSGLPCDTSDDCAKAALAMRAHGHRVAVITMGGAGSVVAGAEGTHTVGALAVSAVDTTGAGDAFCAALAVRLAEGAALPDAMQFASAAGALACTVHGAYPSMPYRAAVDQLLSAHAEER